MADIAKHTPGPWAVSEKRANGTKAYVDGSAGYIVAQAYCSPSASIKYNELWAEAECNARLIAAAPDLLEALKNAVAQLERMGSDGLSSGAIDAIAKAEGRS